MKRLRPSREKEIRDCNLSVFERELLDEIDGLREDLKEVQFKYALRRLDEAMQEIRKIKKSYEN